MKKIAPICFLLAAILCCPTRAEDRNLAVSATAPILTSSEQRVALLIGNSNYKTSPLANPVNDVRAMARGLSATGFRVITVENAGKHEMQTALRDFGDTIRNGGVGLFYYAGHGMQIKGRNFLIPVDAAIDREDEAAYSSIDANQVLDKMEAAKNRLNIVILDACRNNPFVRGSRSAENGLAQMDAPVGTLIAFSTAPGSVASDGIGKNGMYTQHLLESIKVPGSKIEDVFKQVRGKVRKDSGGKQIPWESTSLEGDFIFTADAPKSNVSVIQGNMPATKTISNIDLPMLKFGSSWEYQKVDMFSGSMIRKYTMNLKSIQGNELHFDNSVFDRSGNLLRIIQDGKVTTRWTPSRPNYEFPLVLGKAWGASGTIENDKGTTEHNVKFKVVRQERVLVPAGVFDTLRVEGTGKYKSVRKDGTSGEGSITHRYWFSPDVGRVVAYEYEETNWKGVVNRKERDELLSYQRPL